MTSNQKNPKVDLYLTQETKWRDEYQRLREIALDCRLSEEVKWGAPCYTDQGRNIVLIHGFKEYCALLFFNGALLNDAKALLIQQTENVQAARQIRFTSVEQIAALETDLKAYIHDAIAVEQAGLKVDRKKTADFTVPAELQAKLDAVPAVKTAFEALTPGRQRAYLFYISGAKQGKTREARVEKCVPRILEGKGLDD